jgi:hypothetical protein
LSNHGELALGEGVQGAVSAKDDYESTLTDRDFIQSLSSISDYKFEELKKA